MANRKNRLTTMPLPHQPFLFIRHGQTDWNVEGRLQGHTDIPLNATGMQQAQNIHRILANTPIDMLVTSPLLRAKQTAEVIHHHTQTPLFVDANLKEASFGDWEGRTKTEIALANNLAIPADGHVHFDHINPYKPANADTIEATTARIVGCISHWLNQYPNQKIAFVGHAATLFCLSQALTNTPLVASNATPYQFTPPTQPSNPWQLSPLS